MHGDGVCIRGGMVDTSWGGIIVVSIWAYAGCPIP